MKLILLTTLGIFSMIQPSWADLPDRTHPLLQGHPQTITNGVQVKVTPRGEEFFRKHLDLILQSMSFYPDQGFFPIIESPLDIAETSEDEKRLKLVKETLETFIKGLKISEPSPTLSFENLGYTARITKLSLSVDRLLSQSRNLSNGAVFMLDLEADQIAVDLSRLAVSDPANDWAGWAGLTQIQLQQKEESIPLHARAWLEVKTNPENYITDFKILKINSSIAGMNIEYQVEGVDLPEIAVHMNGKRYPVSRAYLNAQLTQRKVQILEGLRTWLSELVTETLPKKLTDIMNEHLKGEFGNTMYLKPPGAPKNQGVADFIMTFINTKIDTTQGVVLELASRIWDPLNPDSQINRRWVADTKQKPKMSTINDQSFDLAISMNKGLINHLLKLSYERGYFKNVPLKTGGTMSLTAAPIIETIRLKNGGADPNRFKIWIKTKMLATGMQKLVLKDWIDVSFEVSGKLIPNPKGKGLLFACEYINTQTLKFPESNYNNQLMKIYSSQILPLVRNAVNDFNITWAKNPLIFDQAIPLPPSFFGLETKLEKYEIDPAGFMTMYLTLPQGEPSW